MDTTITTNIFRLQTHSKKHQLNLIFLGNISDLNLPDVAREFSLKKKDATGRRKLDFQNMLPGFTETTCMMWCLVMSCVVFFSPHMKRMCSFFETNVDHPIGNSTTVSEGETPRYLKLHWKMRNRDYNSQQYLPPLFKASANQTVQPTNIYAKQPSKTTGTYLRNG